MIDPNSDEEHDGWSEILKEPHGHERESISRTIEEEEWHHGCESAANQQ
jgi:hypothetical protein